MPTFQPLRATILAAVLSLAASPAFATWSIVAVDEDTGEVGAAAATCTVGVEMIYGLVPGKGAMVAQAATNLGARDHGVRMIRNGVVAEDVVDAVANETFNPGGMLNAPWTGQQYGVATLTGGAAAASFTGDETDAWAGSITEGGVSVQGNILRDEAVVQAAFDAYQNTDGPMADRLIAALEAGAAEGGDRRCDADRASQTAFVAVAQEDDRQGHPSLLLVAPKAFGAWGALWDLMFPYEPDETDPPATDVLRQMYEDRQD